MSMSPSAWLAQADPDREYAEGWLSKARIVLLPLGRVWDAVKVPRRQGLAVVETGIEGPVIYDPAGQSVFFLVPPGSYVMWQLEGTSCLGDACWLSTPVPEVTHPPGPHWLQPPDGSGQLVDADALRSALVTASLQEAL